MPGPLSHRGALTFVLLGLMGAALLCGGLLPVLPDWPVARILDSLRAHLLILAALAGLGAAGLGRPRPGLAGAAAACFALCLLAADYHTRSAARGKSADLSVIWFNVWVDNPISIARIAREIRTSGADIVALVEARPVRALRQELADLYPHSFGCDREVQPGCSILILSRWPLLDPMATRLSDFDLQRRVDATLRLAGGETVALRALHMVKPWQPRFAAEEEIAADAALAGMPPDRPHLVIGDFNAAPWSRRMLRIERTHGLRHAALPVATWPVAAGRFGVPIDHVLVGGPGVALTSLDRWGAGLGSNHAGLIARIDLGAPPDRP